MALTKITGGVIDTTTSITAVGATFSGSVSVAGTITYDDVTNIDSVGLVTARSGIVINDGGLIVTGVTTVSAGSTSTPSISPSGDTNTGIFFPSADTIAFAEGGSEAARIDSSGRLLVGTTSATTGTSSQYSTLQVVGGSSGQAQATINLCRNENSADISLNELIGEIYFGDKQAGEYAKIKVNCDGTAAGSGDYPARMEFHTTADGASSPTERMRIHNTGQVEIKGGVFSVAMGGSGYQTIFRSGANEDNFITQGASGATIFRNHNATEHARIDSSGRLLIGTTSSIASGYQFQVKGSTSANQAFIHGSSSVSGGSDVGQIDWYDNSGNRYGVIAVTAESGTSGSPGRITFGTTADTASTPTERMRIDSQGRMGLGTASPTYKLHVTGGNNSFIVGDTNGNGVSGGWSTGAGAAYIQGYDTVAAAYESLLVIGTHLEFRSGSSGAEAARIDSSGRLLVGTSSSAGAGCNVQIRQDGFGRHLELLRSYDSAATPARLWFSASRGSAASPTIQQNGDAVGEIRFNSYDGTDYNSEVATITAHIDGTPGANDTPGRLEFNTTADGASSPTERMRIHSNGAINFGSGIAIGGATSTNRGAVIFIDSVVISSGAGNSTLKYNTSSGIVTFDTSSRLVKESIADCPYGIDALKQLQPRKYFRTDDQREEIGFIADELVQVMPEFVPIGAKSIITKNEEDTEQIPIGVNYEKLTAVLTKALQEAIAKIETLEAEVAALKSA